MTYEPAPTPLELQAALGEPAWQLTNLSAPSGWSCELSSPDSLLRVSLYPADVPAVLAWKERLLTALAILPTSEDLQIVQDHIRDTRSIVQTEAVKLGLENQAWDCESSIHSALCHLSKSGRTDAIIFFNDGERMEFFDEVCTFVELPAGSH